jgi:chemotaxis protein MotB
MRRTLICASAIGLAIALGGCGIDKEVHEAVLKDLDKCKADLASTKNNLSTVEAERNKMKDELSSLGGQKEELAKKLGATAKEIEELRKSRAAAEARMKAYKDMVAKLKSMIDSGKISVKNRRGRLVVQLSDKILFESGKTKLKVEGQTALEQLAGVLKDIADRDFLVTGNTDNVPIKSKQFKSNWELSAARAVEVVKFLQEKGVDPKHLGAAGYSEYDPVGDNGTDDGKKENRRIEIVLMPNIDELPKID